MRTHLDLFSGIGGFALAARWAGVETIGFAEIDDYASRVLAKNFPGVTNYGDVRNVPGSVSTWLITGGFPCQPFSVAGKRRGADDDRWLWPEMAKVIECVRPRWILAENVPGIISMELDTVLADLETLDYTTWPVVVPACAVDAPHRRERVWIVANADGRRFQECNPQIWRFSELDLFGAVSNADDSGCTQQRRTSAAQPQHAAAECGSRWQPEPGIRRVAYGVSHRVDRLRGLGNAIVPQVAYNLICMMIAADEIAEVTL